MDYSAKEFSDPSKMGFVPMENYQIIENQKEYFRFCEQCGVEFVDSWVWRYQMGYIQLACLVTYVWYLKHLPSYITNLLTKLLKELESVIYCDVWLDYQIPLHIFN